MELRRALLLFALVLGVAAVATSVSRSPERDGEPAPPPSEPSARPSGRSSAPKEIKFRVAAGPKTERLEAGAPATVVVEVDEAGQVAIEGLGLNGFAEPLTPARFEVLARDEATHPVRFTPAGSQESKTVGELDVRPAPAGR